MSRPVLHAALVVATLVPIAAPSAEESPTVLDPVVVTATRTPEPESQTLASVSVVDRGEIERRQSVSVADALRGLPGVTVDGSGGPGQPASVFLRGSDADHVLVLIDGVKVGSATLGTAPFQDLPIALVDRIEVVRGPRSSLYGSEAIGGVIQIFTRKGGGPLTPRAAVTAGSFDTAAVSGGVSGGGENGWFNFGGSFEQTAGFNACDGRPDPFAGCGVYAPDRDGYTNRSANARAGWRFGEALEVDAHVLRSDNETDFDGGPFSGDSSRSAQQVMGASARLRPLEAWTLTLAGGRSEDDYRAFYESAFIDRFDTTRDTLSIQSDYALAERQLITLGLDYVDDRVHGSVEYSEDSRHNLGYFGEYQGGWGAISTQLSLRQDENQQFGTQTTGNAALGYRLAAGIRLAASYGTAFKAPTFNDLYFPVFGNADLRPEESESAEVSASGQLPVGVWRLGLYQTDIDRLIAFDPQTYQVENVDRARIQGLEASTTLDWQDWRMGVSLTLMDPENRSDGPNQGNILPRRPQQSIQLELDRNFGRWSAGGTLYYAGRRFDDLANDVSLDPYTLLGLRAEYALSDAVRVQARAANLLDEDYETAAFYNQAGRSFYLTLRYEPSASSE
jgi:vitamin B12 transporter